MRFHPFVFTGNAPRKGMRIPLNEINYNEQRDEETGYGYFGARYMDHELMTMWLSVDPMADKYPSISPYAYCAWNPVKLVDPDGMEAIDDWYKNEETGAVFWHEGHAQQIKYGGDTYHNIGESYSQPTGDGKYINYFQNCPVSIGAERDASKLAYNNKSIRTFLIKNGSPLPDSHKKDLFNNLVATRGHATPDMIGIDIGGSINIGIGITGSITMGLVRGEGGFLALNYGGACGVDVSVNVGLDVGYYLGYGSPTKASLNGLSFFGSAGAGSLYGGYSSSNSSHQGWGVFSGGLSFGTTSLVGSATAGAYNSKIIW